MTGHGDTGSVQRSLSSPSVVLPGTVAWVFALRDDRGDGHPGLAVVRRLRERLAGHRRGQVSVKVGPAFHKQPLVSVVAEIPAHFRSRFCHPASLSSKTLVHSSPLSVHFHSDESLTNRGFFLIFRAFSPEGGESLASMNQCDSRHARLRPVCLQPVHASFAVGMDTASL